MYPGQSSSTKPRPQNQYNYQQPLRPTQYPPYNPQQQPPGYFQQGVPNQHFIQQPNQQFYPQQPQQNIYNAPPLQQGNQIVWQPPPPGYLQQHSSAISLCNGRKKALLIGINYFGTSSQLGGCINDVYQMKEFLVKNWGWSPDIQTILILTDDNPDPQFRPTRQNILEAMKWLVRGANQGDSLFFHFSGHGSEVADQDGDESDGYDSTICPVDFKVAGQIIDDEINAIMVRGLAPGCRLTAIFDCCHSGSAMDLPYTYNADGTIKTSKTGLSKLGGVGKNLAMSAMRGNLMGAAFGAISALSRMGQPQKSKQQLEYEKGNAFADVIMISGCKDSQTSADSSFRGIASGALTFSFLESMRQFAGKCSYGQLLNQIRIILRDRYSQKPQLSSARYLDMNQPFLI